MTRHVLLYLLFLTFALSQTLAAQETDQFTFQVFQTAKLEVAVEKGPGISNSFVLDIYDKKAERTSSTAPDHTWLKFEGFDFTQSLYLYGAELGLGYRSHYRIWAIFVIGYELSTGVYFNKERYGLLYKNLDIQSDPYIKLEGTFFTFQGTFSLLMNSSRNLYSDFGLGFRY